MKQLMLDLVHPAPNDILLVLYRGGPKDENEWAAVRRGALSVGCHICPAPRLASVSALSAVSFGLCVDIRLFFPYTGETQ
jgi:hypothetical protein